MTSTSPEPSEPDEPLRAVFEAMAEDTAVDDLTAWDHVVRDAFDLGDDFDWPAADAG